MGSNPTPSARIIEIIEQFGVSDSYAQSNAQTLFDGTGIGFPVSMVMLAILAALGFAATVWIIRQSEKALRDGRPLR